MYSKPKKESENVKQILTLTKSYFAEFSFFSSKKEIKA